MSVSSRMLQALQLATVGEDGLECFLVEVNYHVRSSDLDLESMVSEQQSS